jgi:predicted CopG family antitoxin
MRKRINICIDYKVYAKLKEIGRFGESFSELVSRVLDELDMKSKSLEETNHKA